MAYLNISALTHEAPDAPVVRSISIEDIKSSLREGFADFWAMPTHVVFLAIFYPVIGFVLARVTMGENLLPLVYPLIAGFALLGPFAALGLYELSRRRERGLDLSWSHAFDVFRSPSFGAILALGAVQMLIFVAWIATAHALYTGLFGDARPQTFGDLIRLALTTPSGWALVVLGNGIGFLFAVLALTLSVVSFPLLLDRPVGAMVAVATSVRAVEANPAPMVIWGLIISASLFVGTLPFFLGLALILPILGHATWHLYRRIVVPADARHA